MTRRALVLLVALVAAMAGPVAPAEAAVATTAGQSTYLPQAPSRVLDTRDTRDSHFGALSAGQTIDLLLPATPAGATAAVLNVTATAATGTTVIRVYPQPAADGAPPLVSNLNVVSGGTVANLVVTRLGVGGAVRLHNGSATVHLIADLAGFYVDGGSGAGFSGRSPCRLLDTRGGQPLQAGQPRTLPLTGTCLPNAEVSGVPADASAVVLNVTAVAPTANTFVTVYPGGTRPDVSNLNPSRGQVVANQVVVRVEDLSDTVQLYNNAGTTNIVVDLAGWYVPGSGDVFHPVDPFRVLDTRQSSPVAAGAPRVLGLSGAGALPWMAKALALNLTATRPTANSHVTAYPAQSEAPNPPVASNLNFLRGQDVPNAAVVAAGEDGAIRLAVGAQTVDLVVDVAGWFGPAGDGWDISWPQCTTAGSTTSNHPTGGAFAVIGVTRGRPFTENECFDHELDWARKLSGGAAVYINTNAPGPGTGPDSSHWTDAGPRTTCDGTASDPDCGWNYGHNLAGYVLSRLARAGGERPEIFLDVENGPTWQTVGVNGNVIIAAVNRLKAAGYRVGIYSNVTDWSQIAGELQLTKVQNWTFPHTGQTLDPCSAAASFSGGPVVMRQYLVQGETPPYDHNHAC